MFACLVILFNLIADILYGWLDPRISLTVDAGVAARELAAAHVSPGCEAWRRFRRHRLAVVSVGHPAGRWSSPSCSGPSLWRVPINEIDFTARLGRPSAGASVRHRRSRPGPAGAHALRRTHFARGRPRGDGGVGLVVGTVVGAIAGISRGSVDAALMWLTDLFLSLPQLPLLLLVIYLFRDLLKDLARRRKAASSS